MVTFIRVLFPLNNVSLALETLILATGIPTRILQEALILVPLTVAVMVVVPFFFPFTTPFVLTVAMDFLLDFHS